MHQHHLSEEMNKEKLSKQINSYFTWSFKICDKLSAACSRLFFSPV